MLQFCQSNGKYATYRLLKSTYNFEDDSQKSSKEEPSMHWYCFNGNELRLYLYRAGTAVDGGWKPVNSAVTVNQDVDVQSHIKLAVITEGRETWHLLRQSIYPITASNKYQCWCWSIWHDVACPNKYYDWFDYNPNRQIKKFILTGSQGIIELIINHPRRNMIVLLTTWDILSLGQMWWTNRVFRAGTLLVMMQDVVSVSAVRTLTCLWGRCQVATPCWEEFSEH